MHWLRLLCLAGFSCSIGVGWAQADPQADMDAALEAKMRSYSEYYRAMKIRKKVTPEERRVLEAQIVQPSRDRYNDSVSGWFDKTLGDFGYRRSPFSEADYNKAVDIASEPVTADDEEEDSKAGAKDKSAGARKSQAKKTPGKSAAPSRKVASPPSKNKKSSKRPDWVLDGSEVPQEINFGGDKE